MPENDVLTMVELIVYLSATSATIAAIIAYVNFLTTRVNRRRDALSQLASFNRMGCSPSMAMDPCAICYQQMTTSIEKLHSIRGAVPKDMRGIYEEVCNRYTMQAVNILTSQEAIDLSKRMNDMALERLK